MRDERDMGTMAGLGWSEVKSPSLEDFEALAEDAYAKLPEAFRTLCGEIIIRIDDFPSDEVVKEMELEGPFDILGLFQGLGLSETGGEVRTGQFPNMVFLYRRPILDYWAEYDETLMALVSHVLVHEIGHHFGLSDDDMEEIERQVG